MNARDSMTKAHGRRPSSVGTKKSSSYVRHVLYETATSVGSVQSLLAYGLTRAVFEPQDRVKKATSRRTLSRRGSASSVYGFEIEG